MSRPLRQPPARWHRGDRYAQYLSLSAAGAFAEIIRHEEVTDERHRLDLPRDLWQAWVRAERLADLSSGRRIVGCGLKTDAFIDSDYSKSQALAEELAGAGYWGLLAPSAALPGAVSLTLFGPRYELPMPIPPDTPDLEALVPEEVPHPAPREAVVVALAAERSLAPAHLIPAVRPLAPPPQRKR